MMLRSKIAGIGSYLPERVVTNDELSAIMETSDAWIQERTGIQTRRYGKKHEETTSTMGAAAARVACERAGIAPEEIDFIIFATLSPDYYFPGCGVLLQRELGITHKEVGALDIRNQCSGFIYALSIGDQFVKTGMYRNVLVVGSEMHSMGLDFSTRGRNVTVIFGDGAGAAILQPTDDPDQGILTTKLHSDGTYAEKLAFINPGAHGGYHHAKLGEPADFGYPPADTFGEIFMTPHMMETGQYYPNMEGQFVFKLAIQKFPEVIHEALKTVGLNASDIDMFIPHQANLRISQFVQKQLGLSDDKVWNNIQRIGNTTAASVPIALCEAWEAGKVKQGDLVCLAAFGSGFYLGFGAYSLVSIRFMAIKRIVKLTFRPEWTDRFLHEVFEPSKSAIRAFPGCRHMELLRHVKQPNVLFTLSLWDSPEALESYRQSDLFGKTWAATKALFEAPAEAWSVEVIDAPDMVALAD